MNAKVPLKVGDAITCEGYGCRVTRVEPGFARVLNSEGNSFVVENPINEFYCSGHQGSVPELETLLAKFAAWREEYEKQISDKEKKQMKTKSKTGKPSPRGGLAAVDKEIKAEQTSVESCADGEHCPKPKRERKPKAEKLPKEPKVKVERAKTFDGITDYITGLVAEGKHNEEIIAECRLKYPGCGKAWCGAVADKKRAKVAAGSAN